MELVALAPRRDLALGTRPCSRCCRRRATVPIVFVSVADPVGGGFVEVSLDRAATRPASAVRVPSAGKWLEILKEVAPDVTRRLAFVIPPYVWLAQWAAIQSAPPSRGGGGAPAINARDAGTTIDRAIAAFARGRNGGLDRDEGAAVGGSSRGHHRVGGTLQAARGVLPRYFVATGGLISYGHDIC